MTLDRQLEGMSERKRATLRLAHEYLMPNRVDTWLGAGVPLVIGRREGYRIWDLDGRELLDLHLNGGTYNLGHRHPEVLAALREALERLDVGNHHFPSEARAALAQKLAQLTPGDLHYSVFVASGSEANDLAIRVARHATGRRKIVALEGGFHGSTGLSGAAGNDDAARYFCSDYPGEFTKVPFDDLDAMDAALRAEDVAAVLLETIPATAGFPVPSDTYLPGVKALCDRYGTLYVADEVQTGLGRTGFLWGVEAWDVQPDILITGKGLSGGMYPIAAVVMTRAVGAWLREKGWAHVSTFGGAEIGCQVASRVLDICSRPESLANATRISDYLGAGLEGLRAKRPVLVGVRRKGLVMGLKTAAPMGGVQLSAALYRRGVWAMFAGFDLSVLQCKPGLLIDEAYCDELLRRLDDALADVGREVGNMSGACERAGSADFLHIPTAAQAERLERLARAALGEWSLAAARVDLVKYRENAVFAITAADGERYVMRVHRPGYRTDAHIRSEFEWMAALSAAGVRTPEIVPTQKGEPLCHARAEGVPEPRQCDLLRWISGQPIGTIEDGVKGAEAVLAASYRTLGEIAATVHEHGTIWPRPVGFSRPSWNVETLVGDDPTFGRFWELECLTDEQRRLLLRARDKARDALAAFGHSPDRYGLIHGDFLPENIFVSSDGTRVLDFDDCGQSWYVFELATSVYFLRSQPNYELVCRSYIDGYRSRRALPDEHLALLPSFLMARGLSYLGWPVGRPEIDWAREVSPLLAEDVTALAREYVGR